MRRAILIGLFAILLAPLVSAVNDPGHDTLYVLKIGDSDVVGSINITGNLNASFVKFTGKAFGDYIDIVANGTVLGAPSTPRIMGATSSLYIDSTGGLYLNTKGGTSSVIQVGDTATNGVTLNVSGAIRQQNVLVCLSNGTNCISGVNTGNVSTVTAGSGLTNSGTANDPILNVGAGDGISVAADSVAVDSTVCRSTGANCPASSATGSGWLNTTTTVYLANNATNLSVNRTNLFVDNTNNRVGIGTSTPTKKLTVIGQVSVTGNTTLVGNTGSEGALGGEMFIQGGDGGFVTEGDGAQGGPVYLLGGVGGSGDTQGVGGDVIISGGIGGGVSDSRVIIANYSNSLLTVGIDRAQLPALPVAGLKMLVNGSFILRSGSNTGIYYDASTNKVSVGSTTGISETVDITGNLSTTTGAYLATASGNVGIGTASPVGKLQVAGALNVTGGNISTQQGNGVCFNTACTSRIYYNGSATVIEGT